MHWVMGLLASLPPDALPLFGAVAFWLRMEHRLTRVETRLEKLPCPRPEDCGLKEE